VGSQTSKSQTQTIETASTAPIESVASLIGFAKNTDWEFAQSNMQIYEDSFGEFSDDWGFTSYPSTPTTWVDIPEIKKSSVKFVYNFYTKDERTNGAGTFGILDLNNITQSDRALASADRYPRFNKISAEPTTFNSVDISLESLAKSMGPNLIKDNLNRIQSENTIATAHFSSVYLKDDLIDKEFYDSLASSISFFGLPSNTSGNKNSKNLCNVVDDRSVFSPDGLQIRDSLSNIQSQGVSYAPTDVRSESFNKLFSGVRDISFSFNLNNKVARNLIQRSIEEKANVYENELRSLKAISSKIQENAIENFIPGVINASEYEVQLEGSFEQTAYNKLSDGSFISNSNSIPVGFIIEKYEIIRTGNSWKKIAHDPIIMENYSSINLMDLNVRYGAVYVYNIKTVCLTRIEAFRSNEFDDVEDQSIFAVLLVESAGTPIKVNCVETIPPNPPQNLSFRWDYQEDNLMIYWDESLNPQRDVVRYQVLRRKSVNVPFTLIMEMDFDNSTSRVVPREVVPEELIRKVSGPRKAFRDLSFTKNSDYIYTLASIDARGFTSNYSSQFRITFDSSRNKLHKELVSQSGAPKPYPNIYLNQDLFADTMKDSDHSRIRIFFDPEYYDVFSENKVTTYDQRAGKNQVIKNEEFLDLLSDKYKLQIINVDNQLNKVVNVSINDESGKPQRVPVNKTTMRFFGLKNV